MIIKLGDKDLVLDDRARGEWCKLSYPGHPKGCPNYNKKKSCPPFSKPLRSLVEPPFFLIVQPFDLEAQVRRMKERHPKWSHRQCRNLLYWQKGINKKLKNKAKEFLSSRDGDLILLEVPEANGVNLFKTCENVGIILERNPQKIVRKMMLIGKRKQ